MFYHYVPLEFLTSCCYNMWVHSKITDRNWTSTKILMPLITSLPAIAEVNSQSTGEVFVTLLEIDYLLSGTTYTVRYTNHSSNVTHNGVRYSSKAFEVTLPTDSMAKPSSARLSIEDIEGAITNSFRNVEVFPQVTITIVRVDHPDAIEGQLTGLILHNISVDDSGIISSDLSWDNFTQEPYPIDRYDPSKFPALFKY